MTSIASNNSKRLIQDEQEPINTSEPLQNLINIIPEMLAKYQNS
jgi:hypothetical protein